MLCAWSARHFACRPCCQVSAPAPKPASYWKLVQTAHFPFSVLDQLLRYQRHLGTQLFPPMGDRKRLARFPSLVATQLQCRGDSWQLSSQDVAIAGLGWVAVALTGIAELRVWAPPQAHTWHNPIHRPFPARHSFIMQHLGPWWLLLAEDHWRLTSSGS